MKQNEKKVIKRLECGWGRKILLKNSVQGHIKVSTKLALEFIKCYSTHFIAKSHSV